VKRFERYGWAECFGILRCAQDDGNDTGKGNCNCNSNGYCYCNCKDNCKRKDEMLGSLQCGGESAALGRDDASLGRGNHAAV
jgi:hypothetical protein